MAQIRQQICAGRKTCRIAELHPAGKSEAGAALAVAEVHLGLADKGNFAPDAGCKEASGPNDGGREYWLIEDGRMPRLIWEFCIEGNGFTGAGAAWAVVGNNKFTMSVNDGGSSLFEQSDTIELSPQHWLRTEYCGYRAMGPTTGFLQWADVPSMTAYSLELDRPDGGPPCETVRMRAFRPGPFEPRFRGSLDVPWPTMDQHGAENGTVPPEQVALGSCATTWRTDGSSGYVVYGSPDPERVAVLRFIAPNVHTLIVQIRDPRPDNSAAARSWVDRDHLEIWTGDKDANSKYLPPDASEEEVAAIAHAILAAAHQVGVELDGSVHAGVGNVPLPQVEHWKALDEHKRPVDVLKLTWSESETMWMGVTLAYSQAERGRQARIFATAPIVKNRPPYLGNISSVPVVCGAVDGRWEVTNNPGEYLDEAN
jgi:hypothetical protein